VARHRQRYGKYRPGILAYRAPNAKEIEASYPVFLTPFLLRPEICLSLQPFSRQRRLRRALSTSQRRLGQKPTLTGISPASRQKCVRNAGYDRFEIRSLD